jgi:hypothetical protein
MNVFLRVRRTLLRAHHRYPKLAENSVGSAVDIGHVRARQYLLVVVALVVTTAAVAGCGERYSEERGWNSRGGAPARTPTSDPHQLDATSVPDETLPAKPDDPPVEIAPDALDENAPQHLYEDVHLGLAPSPEEIVAYASLIVVGRVVEILPAQWTTHDGTRPDKPWTSGGYSIITPALVELERVLLVDRLAVDLGADDRVVVAMFGGQVGDDLMATNDPSQHLESGARVLLVLTTRTYSQWSIQRLYPTAYGRAWNISAWYALTDHGMVRLAHPFAESLPTDELIARIIAATEASE